MGSTVTTNSDVANVWNGGGAQPLGASYGKMMMWFFILSDALTFSGFVAAYGFSRFKFIETWPIADEVFTHFPFMHGVSMQDVFDEFARQLVEGKKSASVILESLVDKKLKEAIAGKFQDNRNKKFSELDAEALYSLIDPHEKRAEKNEIDLEEDG